MTEPSKPAGMLYWKSSQFGLFPEPQRYPASSGSPVGSYLAKHELTKEEMQMPLSELLAKYPPPKEAPDELENPATNT